MGSTPCVNLIVKCEKDECKELLEKIKDCGFEYKVDQWEDIPMGSVSYPTVERDFSFIYTDRDEYAGVWEDEEVFTLYWSPYYNCEIKVLQNILGLISGLEIILDEETHWEISTYVGTSTI